jgi:hypothetical protein
MQTHHDALFRMDPEPAGAPASRRASAFSPASLSATIVSGRGSGNIANASVMAGSTGADTTTARARLSASMKANSAGDS